MTGNVGTSPCARVEEPISTYPTTTDHLRLCRSASTPVGTCAAKITTSRTVPTRTSCSGPSPAVWAW